MKAGTLLFKGLMATVLLSSPACMDKGFQTLPSQMTNKSSDDQVSSPDASRVSSQELEDRPIEDVPAPVLNEGQSDETQVKTTAQDSKVSSSEERSSEDSQAEKSSTEKVGTAGQSKEEPKKDSGTADKADFTGPGVLKPTIYYFPTFNEDESKCDKNTMMHASGGKDLLMVCEKTAKECGLQGSCAVIQNGVSRSFNVLGAKDGQDRFFEIKDGCKYGFGVQSSCLDPFYTLAADLNIYRPGQVIFIPAVVGMKLPDGTKHTGYFVIRDRGRGVTGTGRFDFFSGMMAWKDEKNPFTKMGLGDVNTHIPYFKVKGKTAQQVLRHRAFPKLPRR